MADREQPTFASADFDVYRKPTKREMFLTEIERTVPWRELMALVEPYYLKTGQPGRAVTPLIWMLKLYFLQIWYGLSDLQTEEMVHDSRAVQKFLGLDLSRNQPPDETMISRFRLLIEEHNLGPKLQQLVDTHLKKDGKQVRKGKILDPMAIKAPRSTENTSQT